MAGILRQAKIYTILPIGEFAARTNRVSILLAWVRARPPTPTDSANSRVFGDRV
jgi:hypothetical protein